MAALEHSRNLEHMIRCEAHSNADIDAYIQRLTEPELRDVVNFMSGQLSILRQRSTITYTPSMN